MAIRPIGGGIYADDSMSPHEIRTEDGGRRLYLTLGTYQRLVADGTLGGVCDMIEPRPEGTYLIPAVLVDPAITAEVEMALSFVDPEPSSVCILPACGQDAVSEARGFPLCAGHAEALQGWDELV
jgi:hypothetical protein